MKNKLLLLLVSILFSTYQNAQSIKNAKQLDLKGYYTNPVVSPNGKFALLSGERNKGVYILNLRDNNVTKISDSEGSGYGYSWDDNSETVYFKQKEEKDYFTNSKAYSYSLTSKEATLLKNVDANTISSYKGVNSKNEPKIVVYTNLTTLKIEAKDLSTNKTWEITSEEGQYYNALLSHDGKKVAVHKGSDIFVYDINGGKGTKVGTGIVTSWSLDDTKLLGFLDESEDGHNVSNSDLYLFDLTNHKSKKITTTEVLFEMFPYFIDNNSILFSEDQTGTIYIAKIKM